MTSLNPHKAFKTYEIEYDDQRKDQVWKILLIQSWLIFLWHEMVDRYEKGAKNISAV